MPAFPSNNGVMMQEMRDASSPQPDDRPEISIVICTLDEHEAITGVLAEIDLALSGHLREIIVVDDSSDMRTGDQVLAYAKTHPGVRLIKRRNERGLGTAAIRGWEAARTPAGPDGRRWPARSGIAGTHAPSSARR